MKPNHFLGGALLAAASALVLAGAPQTAVAGPQGCPPGLAKKNPPCIPPGQAKQYYRGDIMRDWYRYDRVPYDRYGLPRPGRGRSYIRVGDEIYLIAEATQRVLEVINLLGR